MVFLAINNGSLHFLSLLPLKKEKKRKHVIKCYSVCFSSYKSTTKLPFTFHSLFFYSNPSLFLLLSFLTFIILTTERRKEFVPTLL